MTLSEINVILTYNINANPIDMLKDFVLKATDKTPYINFNVNSGLMQIHGYSLPENSFEFYPPIIEWLDNYIENPNKKTDFDFKLVVINTSSSKMFIDIFRKINQLVDQNNSKVSVVWYYETDDEDIHEMALQYKEFSKAEFRIIGTEYNLFE